MGTSASRERYSFLESLAEGFFKQRVSLGVNGHQKLVRNFSKSACSWEEAASTAVKGMDSGSSSATGTTTLCRASVKAGCPMATANTSAVV